MRSLLLLLFAACLLPSSEMPPVLRWDAPLTETARALIATQSNDGGWLTPARASTAGGLAVPRRGQGLELCHAAVHLLLASDLLPEAENAGNRVLVLAAQALLAEPGRAMEKAEASAFKAACGFPGATKAEPIPSALMIAGRVPTSRFPDLEWYHHHEPGALRSMLEGQDLPGDAESRLLLLRGLAHSAMSGWETWQEELLRSWTGQVMAACHRIDGPSGAQLVWPTGRADGSPANLFGLRWLGTCRQLELERWNHRNITLVLERLAREQSADGTWNAAREDLTAPAILGFLGAGYDHKTPNRYRQRINDGIKQLLTPPAEADETKPILAWRALALAEAYAMTCDRNLRNPAQQAIDDLHRRLLAHPARSASGRHPSATQVTAIAFLARRSALAGGLAVSQELPPIETQESDPWEDRTWSAFAAFLGKSRPAVPESLLHGLPSEPPSGPCGMACTVILHSAGGNAWSFWRRRLHLRPPASTLEDAIWQLLADEIVYRESYVLLAR